jgi:hypothetical protein
MSASFVFCARAAAGVRSPTAQATAARTTLLFRIENAAYKTALTQSMAYCA